MKFSTIFFLIGNLFVFSFLMAVEQVLYNVAGNNNLAAIATDDLFHIASEYPYFSPAQFLLALKQKEQSSYSFNYQIQKAALHFSNPMWLQYQLQNETIGEPLLEKKEFNDYQETVEPKIDDSIIKTTTPVVTESVVVDYKPEAAVEPERIIEDVLIPFQPSIPADDEPKNEGGIIDYSAYALSNHLAENKIDKVIAEPVKPVTIPHSQYQPPNTFNNIASNNNGFEVPTLEAVKQLLEGKAPASYAPFVNGNADTKKANGSTIPSYNFNGFSKDITDKANEISANAVSLSESYNEEEDVAIEEEEEINQTNNISAVLSNQMADFRKPISEDAKLDFENEPLFKIDYFASQGIKIDLTQQPQDKLTLQLRRFTDWLKQVKGQTPNPQDLGTDPELEKAIANIAKTSIAAREIVTETMADVFVKQGKVDKAIQLYIKLSFLDPHKSAYFAEKIQQLKGI